MVSRRERGVRRAFERASRRALRLEHEIRLLRREQARLEREVGALRRVAGLGQEPESRAEDRRSGPVIHVYLVNGQDFYGVVNSMDEESFAITLSNSAGRVIVVPKRNILYYRMKY